jgi:DNA-binding NtrC family response regulator
LGLATVYGIVKQNQGFVNVYSEPAQGTTFKIYLPRLTEDAVPDQRERRVEPIARGDETILLVEDEPGILDIAEQMLENCGYRVLTAATPGEAIAIVGECADEVHLLISDVVMPEMNGPELRMKLSTISPRIRCLYISGYPTNVIVRHGVLKAGVHFLQKPFTLEALAGKVREVLDDR